MRDVTDKLLIAQFKELPADGLVRRSYHGKVQPRGGYALTQLGESLAEVVRVLAERGP